MKTLDCVLKVVLFVAAFSALYVAAPGEIFEFGKAEITIVNPDGRSHVLVLDVAVSRKQRAVGLMFREQMPESSGMIFIFPAARFARMWMKNTPLELDMLFVDEDGVVREIQSHVHPLSNRIIISRVPVRYVIELKGGASANLGIRPGSRMPLAFSPSENSLLHKKICHDGGPTGTSTCVRKEPVRKPHRFSASVGTDIIVPPPTC